MEACWCVIDKCGSDYERDPTSKLGATGCASHAWLYTEIASCQHDFFLSRWELSLVPVWLSLLLDMFSQRIVANRRLWFVQNRFTSMASRIEPSLTGSFSSCPLHFIWSSWISQQFRVFSCKENNQTMDEHHSKDRCFACQLFYSKQEVSFVRSCLGEIRRWTANDDGLDLMQYQIQTWIGLFFYASSVRSRKNTTSSFLQVNIVYEPHAQRISHWPKALVDDKEDVLKKSYEVMEKAVGMSSQAFRWCASNI